MHHLFMDQHVIEAMHACCCMNARMHSDIYMCVCAESNADKLFTMIPFLWWKLRRDRLRRRRRRCCRNQWTLINRQNRIITSRNRLFIPIKSLSKSIKSKKTLSQYIRILAASCSTSPRYVVNQYGNLVRSSWHEAFYIRVHINLSRYTVFKRINGDDLAILKYSRVSNEKHRCCELLFINCRANCMHIHCIFIPVVRVMIKFPPVCAFF